MYSGLHTKTTLQTLEATARTSGLYWDRMEIAFKIFRLLGYIPYKISDGNDKIESSSQAWLWVGFATSVHMVLAVITDYMRCDAQYWNTYDKVLESLIRLLFTNNIVFILTTWSESDKIIKYINGWSVFLTELEKTTFTPVTCFSRQKFRRILTCVAIITLGAVVTDQFTLQKGFNLFLLFSYFVSIFVSALVSIFWVANCLFIRQVARCFKHDFLIVLKTKSDSTVLNKYRILWLQLRNNAINLPETFKGSIGLQIIINVLSLIFSIYTWMTAILYVHDINRVIGLALPIAWNILTLMAICEFSDMVSREIGQKLISEMLCFNLSTQNYETLVSEEMDSLFSTFDGNSPDFVIYGCLALKRSMLITVLSNIVTYIIVLLQFDLRAK